MKEKKSTKFSELFEKTLRNNSLSLQIIVPFLLLIALTIFFLSWAFYQYNSSDLEKLSISNTKRQLAEVNYSIDSYIDNMKSMGQVVVDNHDVRQLLSFYNTNKDKTLSPTLKQERDTLVNRASTHMGIVANTRDEITNISIVPLYGDPLLSDRRKNINPSADYREADWFLGPLTDKNKVHIFPSHVQNLIDGEYRWVISISEVITDPVTGDITGVMLIDLNYAAIESIFDNAQFDKSSYVYLLDEAGGIIFHPQQQLIYSGIKSEPIETMLNQNPDEPFHQSNITYLHNISDVTGWSTVGVINLKELSSIKLEIIVFYALIAISALLFSAIVAVVISGNATKPIRQLQETMDQVRTGDLTVRAQVTAHNEVGQLADSFNIMISQIQNLIDQTIAVEKEKRRSEIRALQAQINPHFLYNTLDTIIWMSASGKNEDVMEVTSALAHLFRTSISQDDGFVPVSTEMSNIENYLVIQKMRYKDKLTYEIETDENVKHLLTPKLILQPIVENALYHGIKPLPHGGTIWISVFRREPYLIYRVEDNGVGINPEQMDDLLNRDKQDKHGIGIINVNERLKLLFGPEYRLHYSQRPEGGTIVEIYLPTTIEEEPYA